MIEAIEAKFEKIKSERSGARGVVVELKHQIKEASEEKDRLQEKYEIYNDVLDVLRIYSKAKEQEIKDKIDVVISKGLKAIFPDEDFSSKLLFDIKRGQAVVEPRLISSINGEELSTNPLDSDSGGVANVVGFLYQIIVLSLLKPKMRPIIFADEPFRNLSDEYLEGAADFIRMLAERLGIQIVLVTHKAKLATAADKVYRFSKSRGRTEIEQVK